MGQIFGVLTALIVLALVVQLMRKGRLRERHAVWWLAAGLVSLFFAIFPELLQGLSAFLGIAVPTNFLFFVSIAALFFAHLQSSAEITRQEEKIRVLAEHIALLEMDKGSPKR